MPNIFQQTWSIIPLDRKKKAIWIVFLLFLGMVFEVFSIALIVPFIAIILDPNFTENYPMIDYFKDLTGITQDSSLPFALTLLLIFSFFIKAIFTAFIVRSKAKFIFGVRAKVAENLYRSYLLRPYSFHLIHNSAEIIRNTLKRINTRGNN